MIEMTKITRIEVIDENGRSYVSWEDDNDVSYQLQDDGRTLKVFVNKVKEEPKTLFDVIRNLGYSVDCCDEIVDAVEAFQKSKENEQGTWNYDPDAKFRKQEKVKKLQEKEWSYKITDEHGETNSYLQYLNSEKEWKPKPQEPEEVAEGLRNAMRTAIKEGIIPEVKQPTDELIDKLVKNPPEFLKFELGKTLEDIVNRWWCDTFTGSHENWSMEECIDDLIDQIHLWIPKEQSSEGSQDIYAVAAVEGFNDAIKKIKSKLRNKKA